MAKVARFANPDFNPLAQLHPLIYLLSVLILTC